MTAEIGVLAFIVLVTLVGTYAVRKITKSRHAREVVEERERPQRELDETDKYLDQLGRSTSASELDRIEAEKNRNRRRKT